MVTSDHLSDDELITRMQKRIVELEKANQALRAEVLEHKQAEEALRESEERLRTVVENSRDGINMLDLETGRYVFMSPSQVDITGFTAEEINNISDEEAYERVHPEDREVSVAQQKLVAAGLDTTSTVEYRWKVKSGEYRWFSDSRKLVRNSQGRPIALVGVSRDITERKQSEKTLREAYEEIQMQSEELQASNEELQAQSEELRAQAEELEEAYEALIESEKRYRLLFDQSLDAIILTDPRNGGKILSANPAAYHMLGWSEKELIGKGRDVMFDLADPVLSALLDKRARSGSAKAQLTYRRKDGTTFPGEVSTAFFIDNNGEPRTVAIIRDITERRQAEGELSRERSLLESVMQTTDFMLVFFDPQFNFVWVNPAYAESCKMKPEEMVGKNHFALYPHAENEAIFRKVRDTGEGVFYKDKPFVYPDQPERGITYWDWSLAPVKDLCGDVEGLVFSLRETTKYKQAEEALRKSEERYRILFTNMTEAFFLAEIIYNKDCKPYDYRFLEVNPAYELSMGVKKEQILGKTVLEVFRNANPIAIEKSSEVALSGKPMHFEIFSREANKYFEVYAFSHEKDKFAMIFRDVTERKEAEAKLKETLDNLDKLVKERTTELEKAYNSLKESEKGLDEAQKMAHLGNWNRNFATDEIYWSDEAYRIFGLAPQEFGVTYNMFLSYIHPDDRSHMINTVKKALDGKPYSIDFRIIPADGIERIVHSEGEVTFDEKNTPVRMRGTIQDITERKIAEKALEKMDKIRIKEIHHRIKNNLQVISSLLSLEAEKFSDTEVLEAFQESQNRVASMALIHEELYRSKGSDNLDFAAYLRKLTADLLGSYNLRNKDISLKLNVEQVYLNMDTAIPLGIIVNELVSNSLKHAFPKGKEGEISITLQRTKNFIIDRRASETEYECEEEDTFHYILTVEDNGKGIPEKIDLQNVDSLGLQLVNILVEQIDGCVELKRDHGTGFTIWFNNTGR